MTVGSGFAPDLLTPPMLLAGARGLVDDLSAKRTYRRWGISPRPEDALISDKSRAN
jgi:hypothetical protein